jgi:hypothetical protein
VSRTPDRIARLSYEYQQLVAEANQMGSKDETTESYEAWVDPSVYAGAIGDSPLIEELIDAERYPGEAFVSAVDPDPETIVPAFAEDVAMDASDIVGVAGPSTQLCDDIYYALFRSVAETGAVLTTKYPDDAVRTRLPDVDPIVLDCTPGATAREREAASRGDALRCDDLTAMGVAAQSVTDRLAECDQPPVFGVSTVTQLRSHHEPRPLEQFLHELVGQWRNHGVGGLVHVPPARGDQPYGAAHFDYVVEVRADTESVEARVRGKRAVDPTWRTLGSPRLADDSAQPGEVVRPTPGVRSK